MKGEQKMYYTNIDQKRAGIAILIVDKVDLRAD